MIIKKFLLTLFGSLVLLQCLAAGVTDTGTTKRAKPKLVVNIVVGGLPYDYVYRYAQNLSENGFRRFEREGLVFSSSYYNYMPTTSVSSLATLTTGTYPYIHGIVGRQWRDVLTGGYVSLIDDSSAKGLGSEQGKQCYSNYNLVVPTLGDRLQRESPDSKVLTVAVDPASAIVMGGFGSDTYWFDAATASWTSSNKYMSSLPDWVCRFNDQYKGNKYLAEWEWKPELASNKYINRRYCNIDLEDGERLKKIREVADPRKCNMSGRYGYITITPLMNDLLSDFVRQAVVKEKLGEDSVTDILNICFDAPREVFRRYGPESVEAEDMFYQIDRTVGDLVQFVTLQFGEDEVLFVLTSDHGVSESYDMKSTERERFNGEQFRTIVNTFLCAQYGGHDWVSGYYDRRIYINRSVAFNKNLSLDEVQRRAADFALQFRGLSRVVPSCELRTSSASDVYMQKLHNGYFPKRSGDLLVDLAPNWIEEAQGVRASTGSAYDYDTHVPLMIMGGGVGRGEIMEDVDMASVPAIIARIMGIKRPDAATVDIPKNVLDKLK